MQLNFLSCPEYPNLSKHLQGSLLTDQGISEFRQLIHAFYKNHGRPFLWRNPPYDPYHIVISEIMLQQTQTDRVKSKFEAFINEFPDIATLAQASTQSVVRCWQGLGYNRRALAIRLLAQRVMHEFNGKIPDDPAILVTFKGIGSATAASISAFAFNKPTLFIETNIRAVYIHTFFQACKTVSDSQILPLMQATLDHQNPRIWYYALMDYGVALKKAFKNPSRKSKHYSRQSRFEGSDRQIRGLILKVLSERSVVSIDDLHALIPYQIERIACNLTKLDKEGFIVTTNDIIKLQV